MVNLKKTAEVFLFITVMLIGVIFINAEISKGEQILQNGEIHLTIPAGAYEIKETEKGHQIFVENFNHLIAPGKPVLPAKNFLIALPPGARVQSAEIKGIGRKQLSGTYRIRPAPMIIPVSDPDRYTELKDKLQREWQENKETIYSADQSYPEVRGRLTSSGTLRKYSYASVSFYPFSYHPRSGRLIHYDAAEIILRYSLPSPGSYEAQRFEELKGDTLSDEKASSLFVNYQDVKELYQPRGLKPKVGQQAYDYLIITATDLYNAITSSDFLPWKTSLGYNLRIVLITDTEIVSQPGVDLAEKIRNFLRSHYLPWGIEYVLFVGDHATVPMRLCYPHPYIHTYNPDDPYNPGGAVPTDFYYADLSYSDDISWDSDGDGFPGEYTQDSPDFLAEVNVGRIPTNDPARITYALNKLVDFEQDTTGWKNQALHAGAILFYANQDFGGHPVVDGATCLDSIERALMSGWIISHYSEQAGLVPSVYPWPALSDVAFYTGWRNGEYAIVNWAGHGSASGASRLLWEWDDGDGVPETDGSDIISYYGFVHLASNLEDDYPSIVFAISCNVGYPEPNWLGNLGIDLLTKPSWGASAGVISASRGAAVSGDWRTYQGGTESICYEFNRYMINESKKVGQAIYESKFYSNQNYGWDHYLEYQNMFVFNLYGDPSLSREGMEPTAVYGDANGDEEITVSDVIYLINFLFKEGPAPDPVLIGDSNCDVQVTVSDVVYLINYLFKGGPLPGC